jgi:hypothetical protein
LRVENEGYVTRKNVDKINENINDNATYDGHTYEEKMRIRK